MVCFLLENNATRNKLHAVLIQLSVFGLDFGDDDSHTARLNSTRTHGSLTSLIVITPREDSLEL